MNIKKLRELKKNKKGFTLIEIIVVVVILAVLMAVAVPSVLNYLNSADDAKYMSAARAQMTEAQVNIADNYTKADDKANWSVASVNFKIITAKPAIKSVAAFPADATNPENVEGFTVTFTDDTVAKVTVNDKVEINPEVEESGN